MIATWFYAATFVSSLGSLAFSIAAIPFLLQAGYDLGLVGFFVAAHRITPMIASLVFGDLVDRVEARKLLITSECLAVLLTCGVAWAWLRQDFGYFTTFACVRASLVAVQVGARARMTRTLASKDSPSERGHVIWLNKFSHGSVLFAALLSWAAASADNFIAVIALDGLSYVAGGFLMWFVRIAPPKQSPELKSWRPSFNLVSKFRALYAVAPKPALADLALAIVATGTMAMTARLAGDDSTRIPLYITAYGVAVWASGFIEKTAIAQRFFKLYWYGIAIGMVMAFQCRISLVLSLAFVFLKDLSYWILFHRISYTIQESVKTNQLGAITAAKTVQLTMVLAIGEFLVGWWSGFVPVSIEGIWRGVFALLVAAFIPGLFPTSSKTTKE
jgi:hypothetical protein